MATARKHRAESRSDPSRDLAWLVGDPVRFAQGILRHDTWSLQEDVLAAVQRYPRVAVKACHASSKTFTAAEAVLWWVTRWPDGIAVTTAPTWTQVERLLWGEIHKAVGQSRIAYPPLNKTELPLGPNNYAIGISTNEGVRFQGWHGRILMVIDEAPGVLPDIWEAIEGVRAGGDVHVLALGNPVVPSGHFYDAFTANRAGWKTMTIGAFDTPNLEGVSLPQLLAMSDDELGVTKRPYLVTRRWVREKYHEWGPGHPLWESRVLGQFPKQSDNALVWLSWLERARELKPVAATEPLEAGVDVAGPGEDETVVSVRQGPNRIAMGHWTTPDSRGEVAAFLAPFKSRLKAVKVDEIGQGWYFMQHLNDLGFPVVGVNVQQGAGIDKERFADLKAKMYWALRERAEAGDLGGITDETEIAQIAQIQYHHTPRGQVIIESKDELRKRGGKSPDRAEADMLAFASPPKAPAHHFIPASESYVTV